MNWGRLLHLWSLVECFIFICMYIQFYFNLSEEFKALFQLLPEYLIANCTFTCVKDTFTTSANTIGLILQISFCTLWHAGREKCVMRQKWGVQIFKYEKANMGLRTYLGHHLILCRTRLEFNWSLSTKINTHMRLQSYSVFPKLSQNTAYESDMSNIHLRDDVAIRVAMVIL